MKKYIDFNIEKKQKKKEAKDEFEKSLFKLMNSSAYGKTMKNLRKRIIVKLVSNTQDYLIYVSKPTFISQKNFIKDFPATHEIKLVLVLNKPICVGFTVLELSKYLMYDFHYNFIKKKIDADLLFTDTDSLAYEIKSKDVYEEFFKCKHLFDFSEYKMNVKEFQSINLLD